MCVVAEFTCDREAFVIKYVADDDLGAFADQLARVFGAHATGTAGDQRDFSVDSSHGISLCFELAVREGIMGDGKATRV